jgi:hypothetical protein
VGIEPTVPLPGQQFSRLPDSATLAPLRLVELASRQGRAGADVSTLRSTVEELTLGSVIFQSVSFRSKSQHDGRSDEVDGVYVLGGYW